MKYSFATKQSLSLRAVMFGVLAIFLMLTDYRSDYLQTVRTYLLTLVYPIQYAVDLPLKVGQWLSTSVNSRQHLLAINAKLSQENLLLRGILQKFEDLKSENKRLRNLLGSAKNSKEQVQIAEILAVNLEHSKRNILINKGQRDGVFTNQPVIDAQGVMGQVIKVGLFSSVVMLITDSDHELPVEIVRTTWRTVAKGMGTVNRLSLLYLSNTDLNAGVKVGDLIVTSGFGQKFPRGYPVGTIIEVNPDIGKPYAQVQALPRASLEHNREVLLVWHKKLQ